MIGIKSSMKVINRYRKKLILEMKKEHVIDTIDEWIVDNYYMVVEQERYIKDNLYSSKFFKIKKSRRNELEKIIDKIIEECDYLLDVKKVVRKINKYQKNNEDYFSYIEIDYIYCVISLILVNKLSFLCYKLDKRSIVKEELDELFKDVNYAIEYLKTVDIDVTDAHYIEQLNYKLRAYGKESEEIFVKLNDFMKENNLDLKDVIKSSHDELANDNYLISNIFNSFKILDRVENETIYKSISYTEKELLNEDAKIYGKMYENNKENYRRLIIKYAKREKISEYEYALKLVEKANKAKKHIGEVLIKKPNYELRIRLYLITGFILTLGISYLLSLYFGWWMIFILPLPVTALVRELLNHLLIRFSKRNVLNKIEFENGIPEEHATMVVIPTILEKEETVNNMFDNLEIYYLSNKSENLYFTLLGDCKSAPTKDIPLDEKVMKIGLERVKELNKKYGEKFYFVYRNRFYNDSEEEFLGYERKRGALAHFHQLLLGKLSKKEIEKWFRCNTFVKFDKKIKYVMPLDRDTKLVLGNCLKLVGTMAHPLNKPVLSKDRKKVIDGYGILQPRIEIDIETTEKSHFSQLFAGLGGLDIYATAACHHYQDVFGEGFFAGKGIYDLEIFEELTGDTFPENLILSHDMLEGAYLRCGYVNDIILYDDYPASYLKDSARYHRWTRGDWQISEWVTRKVRNIKLKKIKNPIRTISKWQIFDNLIRELTQAGMLLVLLLGIMFGKAYPSIYFIFNFLVIFAPLLLYLFTKIFYRSKKDYFLKYYLNLIRGMVAMLNKAIVVICILPFEAYMHLDAIIRAMYRKHFSHKNMLNWIISSEIEAKLKDNFLAYVVKFKPNYIAAIIVLVSAYTLNRDAIPVAYLLSVMWIFAPILMYVLSRQPNDEKKELNKFERNEVKEIARDIWHYFDEFLNEENNYLIPDNYQLNRLEKVDHRTSPTNIAFSLTSVISAYELGFVDLTYTLNMLSNIVKSVERLEKWNGQMFNWYEISTLKKLNPAFVSSVDNGNMISSLYVVKAFAEANDDNDLLHRVYKLIEEHDFTKLYNKDLDLLSVGYDYTEGKLLTYHYNNFASESRLASYVAIAKGDVPYKHWFCLDKTLTKYKGYKGVVSWSGTAFEYFMPLIFMGSYNHTLIDESCHFALYAQKHFIKEINRKLPWGISESAYNELDDSQNYKYKAFGVPYLKFKESPTYRIVISPYSSLMAIGIDEAEVYSNINKLKKYDMYGKYGFYEAYDYEDKTVVQAYYAHHLGMSLAAITNYLKKDVIRDYFYDNKEISGAEMLLKEKVQLDIYIDLKMSKYKKKQYEFQGHDYGIREYNDVHGVDEYSVVSNGFYSVILNQRGVGFSKYKNLQINRFRKYSDEDYGLFMYVKDLNSNKLWTNTYAPINSESAKYKIIFASDKIKYIREDDNIVTTTEIAVPKDHTAEIRKVTFANNGDTTAELEVTSYSELIMCRNEEDIAHRTFNGMSIKTELDEDTNSVIYKRNSKTKEKTTYYIVNRMFMDEENDFFEFETSRTNFIGRNRSLTNPSAIMDNKKLSNSAGLALDPIMSIRRKIEIAPGEKKSLYLIVGFGKSREQVMEVVSAYYDEATVEKAFELSAMYSNMVDNYSQIDVNEKRVYNKVLKHIYDIDTIRKDRDEELKNNSLAKSGLWKFGISGNLPIISISIDKIDDISYVESILRLYEFFKSKAIYIDIVIINNEIKDKDDLIVNYVNKLLYRINNLNYFENTLGNVYHISSDDINNEERNLIKMVSILSLDSSLCNSFEEQIDELYEVREKNKIVFATECNNVNLEMPKDIKFYNEYGGFINNGREYLINTTDTPMPWINVLAGEKFGSIISTNMGGFTYALNSYEYKLTSWSNDITTDPSSERLIFNGCEFKPSTIINGFGYSILKSENDKFIMTIKVFVSAEKKIKYYDINIKNKTKNNENIDIDLVLNLVLGVNPEYTNDYIVNNYDEKKNKIIFKNVYDGIFKDNHMYVTSSEKLIKMENLDNIDKILGVNFDIASGKEKDVTFAIGIVGDEIEDTNEAYNSVINKWNERLGTISVNTPDDAFNYAINGWYLYQVYASRLIAKSGFYQVSGAIGYRDQLQDVLAVIYNDSEFTRNQILNHSKHQFREGDVLHWWHEDLKFGTRTRFSDDYLWLIYVVNEYLRITDDYKILKEKTCFVTADLLDADESEKGVNYEYTSEEATLYEHMKLCINKAINNIGKHGLPLMGSGDWNDGMNNIGAKGIGESVFVGFFLYDLLNKMNDISIKNKDKEFGEMCILKAKKLKDVLNKYAWDGEWYLRAFHDNGTSIGSRNNTECKIDVLCQSWSILSNVAPEDRISSIFKSVEERLVDKENNIIKLLDPPFDGIKNDPGYIRDYPKGVRENGGQYTHAALWYILTLLRSGDIQKGYEYYQMINPINRTTDRKSVEKYKTEPYAVAADIYSNENAPGRGGWTWYTGSASWAYKIGVEEIIGFKKHGDIITIEPKVDKAWKEYSITYKYLTTTYNIRVIFSKENSTILDNKNVKEIKLVDDGKEHNVVVNIKKK